MSANQGERIMAVEVRIEKVERKVDEMNEKLDDLLALRHKGVGAFWLASTILGTGIVSLIMQLMSWWRGS